jgi:hypothetical protein
MERRKAKINNELAGDDPPLHLSRLIPLNMLLRHPFGKVAGRIRHRPDGRARHPARGLEISLRAPCI